MEKNICKNCGKEYEFEPKRGTYKFQYCSAECKEEYKKKDNCSQYRICNQCGKEYWWEENQPNYRVKNKWVKSKEYCCFECGIKHTAEKTKNTYEKKSDEEKKILSDKTREWFKNLTEEQLKEMNTKKQNTCMEKHGVTHIMKSEAYKNRFKQIWKDKSKDEIAERTKKTEETTLKCYGVKHASQSEQCKEKIKNTNLERYGVGCCLKNKDVQEKIKKTNLERYGYEQASKNKEVKEKLKKAYSLKTNEEKEQIAEKRKKTCLEKYGVEYISQFKETKDKTKQTCLERYGRIAPFNYEKIRATNFRKYGVEYTCLLEQAQHGSRCISKVNRKFYDKLVKVGVNASFEFSLIKYSYDLKLTDGLLIELNPIFTHNSTKEVILGNRHVPPKSPTYHQEKSKCAFENGYFCLHIWDWDDEDKIVESLKPKEPLYARKLVIREVPLKDAEDFLNRYHFQDSCNGQNIRLGLYKDEELIEIMTFGKPRYNKKHEWELLRLCTKFGYSVVGGAERLFKHFIEQYNPESVISYCDNSKFKGDVYKRLGMELKSYGQPSKHWFNPFTFRHITDNLLRQRGYSQLHKDTIHKKGESNELLMLEDGYFEIFDCGQSTFVWKKE